MLRLEPERLQKEEIEFELTIRGCDVTDKNVKDLCRTLRDILATENEFIFVEQNYKFEPDKELKICKDKLNEINIFLNETITSSSLRKIESKLSHTFGRIEKICPVNDNQRIDKSRILYLAVEYITNFKIKKEELKESKYDSETQTPVTTIISHYDVSKLDLKFSGESDITNLNYFLERVEELSASKRINKQQLFKSAVEFFEGKALIWFRSIKEKVTNWDELCKYLKDEFLPRDYNDKLWEQIKKRTQGDTESIGIYIAYMNNFFNRLTETVNSDVRLKIIKKNLLPFYQRQLALIEIKSIDELLNFGRKLEDMRESVSNFQPPSSSKSVAENDLMYTNTKQKLSNMQLKDKPYNGNNSTQNKINDMESKSDMAQSKNLQKSASFISNKKFENRNMNFNKTDNYYKYPRYNNNSSNYKQDFNYQQNKKYNFNDNIGSGEHFKGDKGNFLNYKSRRNHFIARNPNQQSRSNVNQTRDDRKSEIICFKCKGKNHIAIHCTANMSENYKKTRF